jgi:fumarate hydratase class II
LGIFYGWWKISDVHFSDFEIIIGITNTGTSEVTISSVFVNNGQYQMTPSLPKTINPNSAESLTASCSWVPGNNYQIKVVSSKGNSFLYTVTAPS